MMWPVPVGVRVRPSFRTIFLAQLADCTGESGSIQDFPEYQHELNAAQKLQLRGIAEKIVFSQRINPIAAVAVIGHADRAARLQGTARTAKEMDVSQKRAEVGKRELIKILQDFPNGKEISAKISANMEVVAKGSSQLIVKNAQTELEMKKNRRVEFRWARCRPTPTIHPSIEFPPRPHPSEEDDPNIVFAGQRFKSKIIEGVSFTFGLGFISLTMVIWDIDNHRLAGYNYDTVNHGAGASPIPSISETSWSEFTTPVPIQADQFSGPARHSFKAAGFNVFKMSSINPETNPPQWPFGGQDIGTWTGFTAAVAGEDSKGQLALIANSVRVFRGP
jgi:hypothetical protein